MEMVILNCNYIYIFEFKMGLLVQLPFHRLKRKGYAIPYLSPGKHITLIEINFSKRKRNIVEWMEAGIV